MLLALGLIAALLSASGTTAAEPVTVTSTPITSFKGAAVGERVDDVIFQGGLVMTGDHPDFGGISGMGFLDAERFAMVTDVGHFLSGRMPLEGGVPSGLVDVVIDVIRNSSGQPLPTRFSKDAEALDVIIRDGSPAGVRVGFEHLTRVADFDLIEGRPTGAARPVAIPDWLTALRNNESIESLCIAPPASPVAGSTVIITEGHTIVPGTWAGTMLGNRDRGDLHLARSGGFNPTGCAFLPDGDMLVLERSLNLLSFAMQIRRIPAATIAPGATLDGPVIVSASGREVDNMEGIATRRLPDGTLRVTIISDDNFHGFQRNLLLEFALP